MKSILILLIVLFAPITQANGPKLSTPELKAKLITSIKGIPWGIEFLSPNEILISTKEGSVFVYTIKTKKRTSIPGSPNSSVHGQGGLLDLMLHPDFKTNSMVYFTYTKKVDEAYTTAVAMGELKDNQIKNLKDIFVANNANNNHEHFGSRLVHDGEGHILFSVGDRGERKLAQKLDGDQGKIHRLNLDGTIPTDNPFFENKSARNTIWTFGHRNPQGLVYDYKNKILYEQEHGPRGGDEINIIVKGKNYGWPLVTFGREYYGPKISKFTTKEGFQDPIHQFTPSIAPSGLELYQSDKAPRLNSRLNSRLNNQLNNRLISGALALAHVNALDIRNPKKITETRYFKDLKERVRDVKQSPDGNLYFSTDTGKIFQIK